MGKIDNLFPKIQGVKYSVYSPIRCEDEDSMELRIVVNIKVSEMEYVKNAFTLDPYVKTIKKIFNQGVAND